MQKTLKALSILLQYPSEELVEAARDVIDVVVDDGVASSAALEALDSLGDYLTQGDLMNLQEEYVVLFDRTRAFSLHLFEHVHGESRDRGQAMVDLLEHYAEHGMQLRARELPDYLPLYLEFLSTLPAAEARAMLADPVTIIAVLGRRLLERGSPYAGVFAVLEELAGVRPDEEALAKANVNVRLLPESGMELDKAWQDTEVIFGPGQTEADCSGCSSALPSKPLPGQRVVPQGSDAPAARTH
jgi:nitrate reductase delta subunit